MSDTGEFRQSFIRVSLETAVHSFVLVKIVKQLAGL